MRRDVTFDRRDREVDLRRVVPVDGAGRGPRRAGDVVHAHPGVAQLGEQAALALISGLSDIVFGYSKGRVVSIDLHDAVNNKKILDPDYLHLAKVLF